MHYKTIEEVTSLVRAFEQRTLSLEDWDHDAHLTVCCWYTIREPAMAEDLIRAGIVRLNRTLGVITTPTSGYHETLTLFWIAKVRALVEVCSGSEIDVINAIVRGLADKTLVLFHYSEERINSTEARVAWCPPDRHRLPMPARREDDSAIDSYSTCRFASAQS